MFAEIGTYFSSVFVHASDWSTLNGALYCIKAHWVIFILYWLYYCISIFTVFAKSHVDAFMLLFVAIAGLPVYSLIWWYMLVPTFICRSVNYLINRQRLTGEDKIMGYLMLRAINRTGD